MQIKYFIHNFSVAIKCDLFKLNTKQFNEFNFIPCNSIILFTCFMQRKKDHDKYKLKKTIKKKQLLIAKNKQTEHKIVVHII